MRVELLSPVNYQRLLSCYESTVMGSLPPVFRNQPGLEATDVIRDLDWLTRLLRLCVPEYSIYPLRGMLGTQPFTCQEMGHGEYGRVFRFCIDDQVYALKVFKEPGLVGWHGSVGENFLAAFFSHQRASDAARFYLGDPRSGWMLCEWIDEHRTFGRCDGPTVESLVHDQGLTLLDHFMTDETREALPWAERLKNEKNWGAGGVLVDFGGIRFQQPANPDEFSKRLNNPYYRAHAFELFFETEPEPDESAEGVFERLQDFLEPPFSNEPSSRLLPPEQRWSFFQRYVLHDDIWGVVEDHLTSPEQLGVSDVANAFDEAIQSPSSQIAAVWLIRFMEEANKARALERVLSHEFEGAGGEHRAMAFAAAQLDFVSDTDKQYQLYQWVLTHGSADAQKMAVMMLPRLNPSLHESGFRAALEEGRRETVALLPWFLPLLPEEAHQRAFMQLLEGFPESHPALVEQLALFAPEVQTRLIEGCLALPSARRSLADVLGRLSLDEGLIIETAKHMVCNYPETRQRVADSLPDYPWTIRESVFEACLPYAEARPSLFRNMQTLPESSLTANLASWVETYPQNRKHVELYALDDDLSVDAIETYLAYPETRAMAAECIGALDIPFARKVSLLKRISKEQPDIRKAAVLSVLDSFEVPFFRYCWAHSKIAGWINTENTALKIQPPSMMGLLLTFGFRVYKAIYYALKSKAS